jgi:hypothetical protein
MQTIKVKFGYFWPDFDPADNYFTRVLSRKYNVVLSDDPDLFFFTHAYNGRRDYLRFRCHRVFLGWENARADWNCTDYVLDSDYYANNPRHKRWPIWAAWNLQKLIQPKDLNLFRNKPKFACMVVSNAKAKERIAFYHELSKYKQVDSGGRFLNNVGGHVANKMEFIKDYKFVISFENSSHPGYTTEKLIEPMLMNSIPIYWGNSEVGRDFNQGSFIHINKYSSYQEAIERIIDLDQNEEKYIQLAAEPWFKNHAIPKEFSTESLEAFFDFILDDMRVKPPVASSSIKVGLHKLHLLKSRLESSLYHRLGVHKGFR